MSETKQQKLRFFLCHADEDKPKVRKLYEQLLSDGYDNTWFDEEKLKPGMDWKQSIEIEIRKSHAIIICLSTASIQNEGYVNGEILNALDIAKEKPEGTIFIIPVRLDECEVPNRFRNIHWTNLFAKDGYEKVCDSLNDRTSYLKKKVSVAPSDFKDKLTLRNWWHRVLRNYGRYSCYAIFLALPSDKETIRYLIDFGDELDIISGEDCLIIALTETEFKRSGFDEKIQKPYTTERFSNFLKKTWNTAVKEHVSKGYSVKVAQLFNIEFTKFPCLLIFQDIRSPEYVLITLKRMTAEEITEQMRSTFSIIHKAVTDKNQILDVFASHQNGEALRKAGKTVFRKAGSFAEKTFETAIEAWIGAVIK